jgi:excisionase family DNA binding protein
MSTTHVPAVLDINAAADLLGVTPYALRRWKATGQGPAYFMAGRLVRYEREALLSWIKKQTVKSDRRKKTA